MVSCVVGECREKNELSGASQVKNAKDGTKARPEGVGGQGGAMFLGTSQ